jgi:4-hydroxybenzoate polyprenyltransferase
VSAIDPPSSGRGSLRDGPRWTALAELVRAPAALSVPGDTLAGAAAAGWPFGWRTIGLPIASICFYWAGMALNDYADRVLDAVERPERPIPSGRVLPGEALRLATGLTAAGLVVATLAGGARAAAIAGPLAASIWAYDLALKSTPSGPVAMAACRGLDVLLGAGAAPARLVRALPAAGIVAGHTFGVTRLSRDEVHGSTPAAVDRALGITAVAAGGAALAAAGAGGPARIAGLGAVGLYAGTVGSRQLQARHDPTATNVRRAVGGGILGLMPLQAALIAAARAVPAALPILGAFAVARRLTRRISPT